MPQNLGPLSVAAGLARGFGPSFMGARKQRLEQEKKGKKEHLQNLASAVQIWKELRELSPGDPLRPLQEERIKGMIGYVPGQQAQQPVQMPAVEPFAGRLRVAGAVPSPIMSPKVMREEARITGQVAARIPRELKPPSPGARLVRLYDIAKKRFNELNAEIKVLKETRTEPGSLLGTGFFSNQETIDDENRRIEVGEAQLAKVKTQMDSTVAEGRRLYGESIIFEPPAPEGELMSREEFIQAYINDPMNVQKMAPSEGIIEQAKGVDWQ